MCNQVRGFHRGVWKFITKIQVTFPNCADINLCLHSYLFPSQTELNFIGHHNTYVRLKVIEHFVRRFSQRYFKACEMVLYLSISMLRPTLSTRSFCTPNLPPNPFLASTWEPCDDRSSTWSCPTADCEHAREIEEINTCVYLVIF